MGLSTKQVSSDVQDWKQVDLLQSPSGDSGSGSSMESPKPPTKRQQQQQEPNPQPTAEKLKCPRCDSANTKFCYYNNYNKSQPRYFCKACKRHWTKGGTLRNVPVGGGRKNKRLKTSANTTTATLTATGANISVLAASFGGKNSHTREGVHGSDQSTSLPLGLDDENTARKLLSQAILGPQSLLQGSLFNSNKDFSIGKSSSNENNFNGIFGGSSVLSIPQNHDLKFTYPSFSSTDYDFPCSILASAGQIPNLYGLNTGESSNALDETVMTGFDTSLSCSSLNDKPWPSNESTSNWDWDDMDKFVISDVTIPWDDAEIN